MIDLHFTAATPLECVFDHKERCELLRSYFQKVNPNSIPCTYKSNFESSAIQTLLSSETVHGNEDNAETNATPSKEFGPWRTCTPNKPTEKTSVKAHNENSKKLPRNIPMARTHTRKNTFVRSMSDGTSVRPRRTNKEITSLVDESIKSAIVPIQVPYQYNDDYRQYIESYRRSYTQCKLQEANQARPAAARVGIRAYDFRCGMRASNKQEQPSSCKPSQSRTIGMKTITLQMPQTEPEFTASTALPSFVWSSVNQRSSPDPKKPSTRRR